MMPDTLAGYTKSEISFSLLITYSDGLALDCIAAPNGLWAKNRIVHGNGKRSSVKEFKSRLSNLI